MMGFSISSRLETIRLASHAMARKFAGSSIWVSNQSKSPPALKALPRPVKTMARASSSRFRSRNRPVSFFFISSGSTQLLVGPASSGLRQQMNVRSSTRATSAGSERHR